MRLHKTFLSATVMLTFASAVWAQTGRNVHVDLKETRLANVRTASAGGQN